MAPAAESTQTLASALQHTTRLLNSDPVLAAEQAGEILKVIPGHPMATLLLAIARRAAGDAFGALHALEPLSAAQPNWAAAHYQTGITLSALDRHADALAALRRAVALQPDMPDAWREIGDLLILQGDPHGADAAYSQHIRASTQDPRLMAAAHALCENKIGQAELLLREHLKRYPTDVAAIRMFAEVAGRLRRYQDAENLLVRCLELAPSFNAARYNYAMALYRQNRSVAALQQVDLLMASEPRNSGYRNLRAVVLANIGEYQEALQIYADVLAKHPDQSRIWMSYGHALASAGRMSDSIAAYRRCIALTPGLGEAYYSLANLKTFRFEEDELCAMQERLQSPDLTEEDRAHFHFAIGKALEDSKRFPESFDHYVKGNDLRAARVGWDPAQNTALVQRSKATFTQEFFAARRGFGAPAADPIFIVGLPRAGSTLLEQILASHSSVEGTMELPDIMAMATQLGDKRTEQDSVYPGVLTRLSASECLALGEQYLAQTRIQRKTDKPFFIDKMPNNYLHIGLIRLILPHAKIIDARRHPMACCFSAFKQNFAQGQRYSYSLEQPRPVLPQLRGSHGALRSGGARVRFTGSSMRTWSTIPREKYGVCWIFCGLSFEPATLSFHENDRAVRTASSQQVRKPIFREGLDQWRNYEPWLEPLRLASLGDVLEAYPGVPLF